MAGGAARRKLKRLKRQGDESTDVVNACIRILSEHGYVVSLPYEVPQILQQILAGTGVVPGGAQGGGGGAGSSRADALARLDLGDDFEEDPGGPPIELEQGNLDAAFGAPGPGSQAAVPDQGLPMPREQAEAQMKAGFNKMLNRVATTGVQYRRGQGPAQGRRLVPADGVEFEPETPPEPEGGSIDRLFAAAPGGGGMVRSGPPADGGRPNPVTGLTREESARLIEAATGRRPAAPAGGPVIKPSGL